MPRLPRRQQNVDQQHPARPALAPTRTGGRGVLLVRPASAELGETERFEGGTAGAALGTTDGILDAGTNGTGSWTYTEATRLEGRLSTLVDVTTASTWSRQINLVGQKPQPLAVGFVGLWGTPLTAAPTSTWVLLNLRAGATASAQVTMTTTGVLRVRNAGLLAVGSDSVTNVLAGLQAGARYYVALRTEQGPATVSARLYDAAGQLIETFGSGTHTGAAPDNLLFGPLSSPGVATQIGFDFAGYRTNDWPAFPTVDRPAVDVQAPGVPVLAPPGSRAATPARPVVPNDPASLAAVATVLPVEVPAGSWAPVPVPAPAWAPVQARPAPDIPPAGTDYPTGPVVHVVQPASSSTPVPTPVRPILVVAPPVQPAPADYPTGPTVHVVPSGVPVPVPAAAVAPLVHSPAPAESPRPPVALVVKVPGPAYAGVAAPVRVSPRAAAPVAVQVRPVLAVSGFAAARPVGGPVILRPRPTLAVPPSPGTPGSAISRTGTGARAAAGTGAGVAAVSRETGGGAAAASGARARLGASARGRPGRGPTGGTGR